MLVKEKIYSKNKEVKKIVYNWFDVNDVIAYEFNNIFTFRHYTHNNQNNYKGYESIPVRKGKYPQYIDTIHCGFDIETTKINENQSFMYTWQFCVYNGEYNVIVGTNWSEFITLLDLIIEKYAIKNHNLIIWVANLGFEWQFMKHHLEVTNCFFKELREPIEIEHKNYILFKECLSWGGSLKKLAADYTNLIKLKGDLDYSIYRESYKAHTDKEQFYCDFDVLILSQFSQWYKKQYLDVRQFPKTTTGALRLLIKEEIGDNIDKVYKSCYNAYPKTLEDYTKLMYYTYRGGYTHGNMYYMNEIIHNVYSVDFTSSYPSVLLYERYPYGFNRVNSNNYTIQDIIDLSNDWAFIGKFTFYNVKSTTNHTLESLSKCMNKDEIENNVDTILDNGRVRQCEKMVVYLTELDLLNYLDFYKFDKDSVIIEKLQISRKDYLPTYLIKCMCDKYTKKAILKANNENYAIEKTYVNAAYGLNVTREVIKNICWDSELEELYTEDNKKASDYELYKKKKFILPQWGVWCSAYARRNLLKNVYDLEKNNDNVHCLYMDTDSIKYIGEDKAKVIESYNNLIAQKRDKALERLKYLELDQELYFDLGMFDNETKEYNNGVIKYFKMYGAKRYIYFAKKGKKDIYNCTIAGLPKQSYYKYCNNNIVKFFGDFNENLQVKKCKLGSHYQERVDKFDIVRNGVVETIESSITLNDIDFNMTINGDWYNLLNSDYMNIREKRSDLEW